jgi:hypothetical protein
MLMFASHALVSLACCGLLPVIQHRNTCGRGCKCTLLPPPLPRRCAISLQWISAPSPAPTPAPGPTAGVGFSRPPSQQGAVGVATASAMATAAAAAGGGGKLGRRSTHPAAPSPGRVVQVSEPSFVPGLDMGTGGGAGAGGSGPPSTHAQRHPVAFAAGEYACVCVGACCRTCSIVCVCVWRSPLCVTLSMAAMESERETLPVFARLRRGTVRRGWVAHAYP